MVIRSAPDRRAVLKALGAAGLLGGAGIGSARPPGRDVDELRLFGDAATDGAMEVVTQQNYAYVATGDGMAVVDIREPGRPDVVADIAASDPAEIGGDDAGTVGGILDVKVDGDLAVMAHNGGTGITTVDVSDPTAPAEVAFHNAGHGVHNAFLKDGYAYLTINESDENVFSDARTDIVDVREPMNLRRSVSSDSPIISPNLQRRGSTRTTTCTSKMTSSIKRTGTQALSSRT